MPLLESSPKVRDRLIKFVKDFNDAIADSCKVVSDIFAEGHAKHPDPKDFAVKFVGSVDPRYAPFLYKMRKSGGDSSIRGIVTDFLKKNISTKPRIDKVRWVFGGLEW